MTIDITPEAVERLAYNLSDWGQHDEGLINDYRDDAATTLRALTAALKDKQAETAAAYEVVANMRFIGVAGLAEFQQKTKEAIRALTPADSKAALDRMIADAEERGMREAAGIAENIEEALRQAYAATSANAVGEVYDAILAAIPKGAS
jgi:hypothetical protein